MLGASGRVMVSVAATVQLMLLAAAWSIYTGMLACRVPVVRIGSGGVLPAVSQSCAECSESPAADCCTCCLTANTVCCPVFLAVPSQVGQAEIIRLLAEWDADMEETDSIRRGRPLMHAANNGHTAAVKALVECGADPEATDDNGYTALMVAVFSDRSVHSSSRQQQLKYTASQCSCALLEMFCFAQLRRQASTLSLFILYVGPLVQRQQSVLLCGALPCGTCP